LILVDANILIYAFVRDFTEHERSLTWLEAQLLTAPRVAMPWTSLLSFSRLVTNPRVFDPAVPVARAADQVRRWSEADNVWHPEPGIRHLDLLDSFLRIPGLRAEDIPDAHLAALAVEHGLTLATNDRGFARFDGLSVFDPLRET
jgi:uncharacterized protein